ncbi:hypothetical protein COT49_02010 [candidate division WWE3 bacterium CG08_land_8_20_14_0_20_40_13]|uniref:Uncharacterized protein n=1 Tax=candidate division WWE3 bacterium CG08_land_8_20_14_0_20_40_13 TaxID=1975084 RepID=A0A2H0XDZ9_UNCKA|nr:MAG: hypothetical protein COT49_02010 [candidate division WWE3 bacterium CG08_land_8_20_14_0_20_40_13]
MNVAFRKKYLIIAVLFISLVAGGYSGASRLIKDRAEQKRQAEIAAQVKPVFGNLPDVKLSYSYDSADSKKTYIVPEMAEGLEGNPKVAKVYKYQNDKALTLLDATRIASVLGITTQSQKQEDESYIFYGEEKKSALTFWPKYNQINYYRRDGDFSGIVPSKETAMNTASYYLSQFNLAGFDLTPDSNSTKLEIRKDKEYPEVGTTELYDSVFVPFTRRGLDFKSVTMPYQDQLLYLAIGPGNKILNMALYYAPLSDETSGVYQIKELAKAQEEARAGGGQIVDLSMPDSFYFNADAKQPEISAVSVNSWYLAYLDRQDLEFLQPVYVFSGTASLVSSSSAPVTLYINAVK